MPAVRLVPLTAARELQNAAQADVRKLPRRLNFIPPLVDMVVQDALAQRKGACGDLVDLEPIEQLLKQNRPRYDRIDARLFQIAAGSPLLFLCGVKVDEDAAQRLCGESFLMQRPRVFLAVLV